MTPDGAIPPLRAHDYELRDGNVQRRAVKLRMAKAERRPQVPPTTRQVRPGDDDYVPCRDEAGGIYR